jgi:serine/threonine protein kinase|eukprot:TRINITY_DN70574_c0_g1_i1.p1 TRINITY_DN70574_c0_g1~~TRINITY_DN70574_c0_g1_i1.p1  ORF type:complete len:414 (+),score=92.49 TRINITY_DN70574_c0_g1_i1:71-1243(+)
MADTPWPSSSTELSFDQRLGRGFFGEVWKCKLAGAAAARGDVTLAVKKVPAALVKQHGLTSQMEREINILRALKHRHIVQMYFDFRDSSHYYLGMEFAAGGAMFDRLSKSPGGKFTSDRAAKYFYEACDALSYLHGLPEKIIHRDIKPENMLIDGDDCVKVADFGWSNIIESTGLRETFCGTADYLAPEMIRSEGHNESLDMWEMGVLLYEMVVGKSPFGASTQQKTCTLILKCDLRFPSGLDSDARALIVSLLRLKPEERLTASEAKQHLFVARNYQGRPTEVIPPPVEDADAEVGRASIGDRALKKEKAILEDAMMAIVQAKSQTEQALFAVIQDLETVMEKRRREEKLRVAAKAEFAKLKEIEEKQIKELEELKSSTQAVKSGGGYS